MTKPIVTTAEGYVRFAVGETVRLILNGKRLEVANIKSVQVVGVSGADSSAPIRADFEVIDGRFVITFEIPDTAYFKDRVIDTDELEITVTSMDDMSDSTTYP